jgi:hypothetical protein
MVLALFWTTTVLGYNVPASRCSRRGAILGGMLSALPPACSASTREDLLSGQGQGCTFGEGDGCGALAEGNELILKLQQKSRDNKVKNEVRLSGFDRHSVSNSRARACKWGQG